MDDIVGISSSDLSLGSDGQAEQDFPAEEGEALGRIIAALEELQSIDEREITLGG